MPGMPRLMDMGNLGRLFCGLFSLRNRHKPKRMLVKQRNNNGLPPTKPAQ